MNTDKEFTGRRSAKRFYQPSLVNDPYDLRKSQEKINSHK